MAYTLPPTLNVARCAYQRSTCEAVDPFVALPTPRVGRAPTSISYTPSS